MILKMSRDFVKGGYEMSFKEKRAFEETPFFWINHTKIWDFLNLLFLVLLYTLF
jgi:hypothetical protein